MSLTLGKGRQDAAHLIGGRPFQLFWDMWQTDISTWPVRQLLRSAGLAFQPSRVSERNIIARVDYRKMKSAASDQGKRVWGQRWRSSTTFGIVCISIALFAESFLYSFIIPILPYILQERNHVDPSDIQRLTYQILTLYGLVSLASSVFIGQLADLATTRKMPLVVALLVAIAGTLAVAAATDLSVIYIGRVLQSIGATAAWIVGVATLRDSVDAEHMGKAFGLLYSCISTGELLGPAISGVLLTLAGYWMAWGSVFVVMTLNIAMRLVMVEGSKRTVPSGDASPRPSERSPLIPDANQPEQRPSGEAPVQGPMATSATAFYRVVLVQRRVIISILCSIVHSVMLASYGTTIPTHVKFAFGWDSLPTGLLFALLQVPVTLASPLYGWLRDNIGTRKPTAFGFASLAPILWLLGAANQRQFPWAASEESAKATYVAAIVAIGLVTNLTSTVSAFEITCVVDDFESKQPGIFGPGGGYSRCYSLANFAFAAGLLLGPLLSGALADSVGYYLMNVLLGKYSPPVRSRPMF
ncbi:Major facilitator superfamily domain, general substrate transporter [Metarhizium album ARSEF 1941]|uniref:Major facilitator superfamily domain, general substrate transporter n=1 Tax=Metarhizium album (strain ARSEF 1941) TaxID=1081103 RepID=A0A0B2WYP1_METAS|nr:Major facilitator superfamily domain, general substrate transporter [Metarhizium album ARSEF 1941]KHN97970.1 Major facilitator superfamily domain, general substrate transporter [Metarhizium album ARSEF 1941]